MFKIKTLTLSKKYTNALVTQGGSRIKTSPKFKQLKVLNKKKNLN